MKNNLLCFLGLVFLFATCQAQGKSDNPLLKSIIGKDYTKSSQLSDEIVDNKEGFVCSKDPSFSVRYFVHKKDSLKWFLLLVQMKQNAVKHVVDAVEVDLRKFPAKSKISFGFCKDSKDQNIEMVYVLVQKASGIDLQKAWVPDTKSQKMREIPISGIDCSPNIEEEDYGY